MKHLYYGLKIVDQFAISIAVCLELLCFVLKEFEDVVGRVTILDGLGERTCGEVYACLFGVVGQRGLENGLKVGRGGRC
jgi:hypothetical protein